MDWTDSGLLEQTFDTDRQTEGTVVFGVCMVACVALKLAQVDCIAENYTSIAILCFYYCNHGSGASWRYYSDAVWFPIIISVSKRLISALP